MKLLIFSIWILIETVSFAQVTNFEFAVHMGSPSEDKGYSVTTDSSGNVYTTGYFTGTADFDPSTENVLLTSNGESDIFIQKLDSNGNLLWVKQIGGIGLDRGYSLTTDNNNNVYITGLFAEAVDFDPGTGITILTSNGIIDLFIQKLDPNGNFVWVKQVGGIGSDRGDSITIAENGEVYTTGFFHGTVDFNAGGGNAILTSNGWNDIYILKLDANGDFLWVKQMGGIDFDFGHSITTDSNGNIITTGKFENSVDFDPGAGIVYLTSNGESDIFIQKLDSNGNFIWAKQMGGPRVEIGESVITDSNDSIYTIGSFLDSVDFDPGTGNMYLTSNGLTDIFIQKLDSNGNLIWVHQLGGEEADYAYSLITDSNNNVYSLGNFQGTVDFDPGVENEFLTSNGSTDIFIQKLDFNGTLLGVSHFGGTGIDWGRSIILDMNNNIYTAGYFTGTSDFDPGLGEVNLTSNGNYDIFLQKLNQNPLGIEEIESMNQIKIFPNPNNGIVNFQFGDLNISNLTVMDTNGRVFYAKDNISNKPFQMSLQAASGMYFIEIVSDKGNQVLKLMKQ